MIIIEGDCFFLDVFLIFFSVLFMDIFKEIVFWAIVVSSEKVWFEGIINLVLLEVRCWLRGKISVFFGEEFIV